MARTVANVAMLLAIMAGPDARSPLSLDEDPSVFTHSLVDDLNGRRIGWLTTLIEQLPFEPGVLDLCQDAVGIFDVIGCTVEDARLNFPRERLWDAFVTLRAWLTAGMLRPFLADLTKRALLKAEAIWESRPG